MNDVSKYMTQLKSIAAVTGMVLLVTVGGVMAGAFFVSPLAATKPWVLPTVAGVAILAVIAMLRVWLWPASERTTLRSATRNATRSSVRLTASIPSMSLRTADRTPKNVHALAAAGTTLTEIARRTRLPVDAVSMLLSISTGSRQLQPPTA